jgi:hypothetical protein
LRRGGDGQMSDGWHAASTRRTAASSAIAWAAGPSVAIRQIRVRFGQTAVTASTITASHSGGIAGGVTVSIGGGVAGFSAAISVHAASHSGGIASIIATSIGGGVAGSSVAISVHATSHSGSVARIISASVDG